MLRQIKSKLLLYRKKIQDKLRNDLSDSLVKSLNCRIMLREKKLTEDFSDNPVILSLQVLDYSIKSL